MMSTIHKLGGVANLFGGLFVATAYVLHPHHHTPEIIGGSFWLVVHLLFAFSLLLGIFGLIALFIVHLRSMRWQGLWGFILAVTSLVGIFGLNFYEALINPVLAVEAPVFVDKYGAGTGIGAVAWLFPLLGLMFMAGYAALCWEIQRHAYLASGAARATLVGTLLFGLGLSGLFPMWVVQLGSVGFGLGLCWFGVALLRAPAGEWA